MKIIIEEDDGYRYESEDTYDHTETGDVLAFASLAIDALLKLDADWQALQKSNPERYKYADTFYVDSIILALDGMPFGRVHYLDDLPQFSRINMKGKIEEKPDDEAEIVE